MVVDLIIIGIILLSTFIGYKRGLIKVAVKILSFFIAIILAFTLCTPVTNMIIENTTIDENIETRIIDKILPEDSKEENQTVEIEKGLSNLLKIDKEGTVKTVAHEFTVKIIKAASLILIFIATKILLIIVAFFTDAISELPVISQFNKLGGTIYGLLKGIFMVFVIFAIVFIASPMMDASILEKINSSILGSLMYNNNLLLKIIF